MDQLLRSSSHSALETALRVYNREGLPGFWKVRGCKAKGAREICVGCLWAVAPVGKLGGSWAATVTSKAACLASGHLLVFSTYRQPLIVLRGYLICSQQGLIICLQLPAQRADLYST